MAHSPLPLRFQLDSSLSAHYCSIPTTGRAGSTTRMPLPPSEASFKLNSTLKQHTRIPRNQSCTPRPHHFKNLSKERAIIEAEYHSNNRPSRLDNLDFQVNESLPKSTVFQSEKRGFKLPLQDRYRRLSPEFAKFQVKLEDPAKEILGDLSKPSGLLDNCKNKIKAVKKESVNPEKGLSKKDSYCLSESPLKMRLGNRQQTNLIINHKYIRKVPHRKHSVLSITKMHNSCINTHRKNEHSKSRVGSFYRQFENSLEQEILSITVPVNETPNHHTSQTVSLLSSSKLAFKAAGMTPLHKRKNIMVNGSGIEGIREEELKQLNEARSKDIKIRTNPEQERRFYEYCRKNIRGRKLCLRDLGIAVEGSKVLSSILKCNDHFARLDLSKNNIGDSGLKILLNGLRQNASLVHIDLGSNNLTSESCIPFFEMLKTHDSIISVVLSNSEGMHRNKIGQKGCRAIAEVIGQNKVITLLDVSDNALGHEGINTICEALTRNKSLLTLNISHNNVKRESVPLIKAAIVKSHLMELNLSDSKLNDRSLEELAVVFYNNTTKLETLDLSYNEYLSSQGILLFFQALRSNTCLHTLNLENNNFGHSSFKQISTHLRMNKGLRYLNLSHCNIKKEECAGLAEGFAQNKTLRTLLLDHNPIMNEGAKALSRALQKNKALFHLDLSVCDIGEEAVDEVVVALNVNSTLQSLILRDNKLCGDSGEKLCSAILRNKALTKVVLEKNSVKQKHLNEIGVALQRNKDLLKSAQIPKIRRHLSEMKDDTLFEDLSSAHRKINKEIHRIHEHQKEIEKELEKEKENYQKIIEEVPAGEENGEIENLEHQVSQLDQELTSLNDIFKDRSFKKKKELAAIKFKISSGIDSEAIVRKKINQTRREIDSHEDKSKQLQRLRAELDEQLREQSMMKIIYDNYEKEVKRMKQELDIKLSFKERPQSVDSPRRSPSGSPKNKRIFGVGNINSQNVYFKQTLPEIENVKIRKKAKEGTPSRATPKVQAGLLVNKKKLQKIPEFTGDQKKLKISRIVESSS